MRRNFIPFINFENPLYFRLKRKWKVGIEGIISQKFCWCFWASQTLYNGRTLESAMQTQLEHFWITLVCYHMLQFPIDHLIVQTLVVWMKSNPWQMLTDWWSEEVIGFEGAAIVVNWGHWSETITARE